MADRGTVLAYDAPAIEQGVYEHVMEPTAAFGATVVALDAEQTSVELADYGHPFDGPTDFTSEFTYDRTGTGYYMQPADDTLDVLRAAANGRSQVTGALTMDMPLAGTASGASVVEGQPTLTFDLSAASTGTSASAQPFLAFLKALEGDQVAGSSFVRSPLVMLLGTYRDAVLASSPAFYLQFNEASGQDYLNDPDLGGAIAAVGSSFVQFNSTAVTRRAQSLIETAVPGSLSLGNPASATDPFRRRAEVVAVESAVAPPLSYSVEFWFQRTSSSIMRWTARTELGRLELSVSNTQLRAFRSSTANSNVGGGVIDIRYNLTGGNRPRHLVATYTPFDASGNGEVQVYLDGALLVAAQATSPHESQNPGTTWVERPTWRKESDELGWYLDDAAYYTRVLTAQEVAAHYEAGFGALALAGSPSGIATVEPALITFAGGELEALAGSSAGVASLAGDLLLGGGIVLAGDILGVSQLGAANLLARGPLLVSETARIGGGRRKQAVFTRAKI